MKYWQKVKVTSWFYKWFEGYLTSEKDWMYWITLSQNEYTDNLSMHSEVPTWFYVTEKEIELIK
jgi:hypothetical protein